MRLAFLYRSLLRRAALPAAQRVNRARTPSGNLGRALQDSLEWDVQNRARRKRLGLE
jgi:hypothetical protein